MDQNLRSKRKNLICQLVEDECYIPMKEKELAIFMQVKPEERQEFKDVLSELVREGKLQVTKRGKYLKEDRSTEKLTGTFINNFRGFGFVEIEGRMQDLFIPEEEVNGAFHKDRVQVELLKGQHGKRQEAKVVSVLSHGITRIVGTYDHAGNFGFVIPDDEKIGVDIFVPRERSKGAVTGHKVVVELSSYGDERHKPEGKIIEILESRRQGFRDFGSCK